MARVLALDERHKQDLSFLSNVSPELVAEFCKISLEFLRNGANKKLYASAAQKLKVEVRVVASSVEGLSYLFSECAKHNLSENDLQENLTLLSFPPQLNDQLKSLFLSNKKEIRSILQEKGFSFPQYQNLEWRLDVQIGSRSLRHQTEPVFLLKLETLNPTPTSQFLQTDFVNLKNLSFELDLALSEMKNAHCRRIMRNIK